jgi:transcriptional regulator
MYLPSSFAVTDRDQLHDFIQQHSFGMIVSQESGQLVASHLPILLDRKSGSHGCIYGHMARANSQWQHAEASEVLAVFSGPHTYVSPSWYQAEDVVPTWNYVAVHVYGTFHAIQDRLPLIEILRDSVEFYERTLPQPWSLAGSRDYLEKMVRMVVGFRIDVTRIEGKWKLGQNHPSERRDKVIAVLERAADENTRAVADLMRAARK